MPNTSLIELKIDPSKPEFLKISGRISGFISAILTILRLNPIAILTANRECIDYRCSSLFGFHAISVPFNKVTGVVGGMKKNIWFLILAIICFVLGTIGTYAIGKISIIFLILFLIFGALYYFKKYFYIGFMNGGEKATCIWMKPSLTQGISLNEVERACALIRSAVLQFNKNREQ